MSELQPVQVFAIQFILSLLAWGSIGRWIVIPALDSCDSRQRALSFLLIPQLLRHIGATLLVPGVVAATLPRSFSSVTATGDVITAILALISLNALNLQWKHALVLVWIFNVFGSIDMVTGLIHGAAVQAAPHLQAAWFVPTFGVPMMLNAHFLVFRELLKKRVVGRH